jgi:hypothetical protein
MASKVRNPGAGKPPYNGPPKGQLYGPGWGGPSRAKKVVATQRDKNDPKYSYPHVPLPEGDWDSAEIKKVLNQQIVQTYWDVMHAMDFPLARVTASDKLDIKLNGKPIDRTVTQQVATWEELVRASLKPPEEEVITINGTVVPPDAS